MTSQFPFSFEEISKSPEITDFEELRFVNRFGLNLTYFRFTVQSPVAKIIFIHGGGAYSNLGYFNLAHTLKEKYGIETILLDLVGHGHSEGNRGDCATVESTYQDINDLVKLIDPENIPIYLGGHSSGGGFVLNYSSWCKEQLFGGYIFVSPEFGYKSKTERKGRIEFAKINVLPFIINAISGGFLFGHKNAITLNYPKEVVEQFPLIVTKLTVNMANALTPQNPTEQMKKIRQPTAIFIGENDELFDPDSVINYLHLQSHKHQKSISEMLKKENHLSILLTIGDKIGAAVISWIN